MAIIYGASDAGGGGDGSWATPYTIDEMFDGTIANLNNEFRLLEGTYSPTGALRNSNAAGSQSNFTLICPNSATTEDEIVQGGVIIDGGSAGAVQLFTLQGQYVFFGGGIEIRNGQQDGLHVTGNNVMVHDVQSHDNGSIGINNASTNILLSYVSAYGNTFNGIWANQACNVLYRPAAWDNGDDDIVTGANASHILGGIVSTTDGTQSCIKNNDSSSWAGLIDLVLDRRTADNQAGTTWGYEGSAGGSILINSILSNITNSGAGVGYPCKKVHLGPNNIFYGNDNDTIDPGTTTWDFANGSPDTSNPSYANRAARNYATSLAAIRALMAEDDWIRIGAVEGAVPAAVKQFGAFDEAWR
jgi:hypothetical protein